jgi:hypothetical protein
MAISAVDDAIKAGAMRFEPFPNRLPKQARREGRKLNLRGTDFLLQSIAVAGLIL